MKLKFSRDVIYDLKECLNSKCPRALNQNLLIKPFPISLRVKTLVIYGSSLEILNIELGQNFY